MKTSDQTPVAAGADVIDPVCGMTISPADAVGHADYKGQTYYFCNQSCLDRFRATPATFLAAVAYSIASATPLRKSAMRAGSQATRAEIGRASCRERV